MICIDILNKKDICVTCGRNMSDAGSDDLDEERAQDLGVRISFGFW